MSVDPGLTTTGYAVLNHAWASDVHKPISTLHDYGGFRTDKNDDVIMRVRVILDGISKIAKEYHIDNIVIERPANTIYTTGRNVTQDYLIARAQSVFQLFGLVYGLQVGLIERFNDTAVHTIMPTQWQQHRTKRNGLDTKEWSLKQANERIRILSTGKFSFLNDTFDENVADAINIGFKFLERLEESWSGK